MDMVLDFCCQHLDVQSLISLFSVSSACRSVISNTHIWYQILRNAGFKRLSKQILKVSTFNMSSFRDMEIHVQNRNACFICWKKNARPIRLMNNVSSSLCISCEGDMLWSRKQIAVFLRGLKTRPSIRMLFSNLVVAKRRKTKQHLYWKKQVFEVIN